MLKWLHTIGSGALAVLAAASPGLQAVIALHPAIAGSIAAGYMILGQFLPHADPAAGLPQTPKKFKGQPKPL